VGATRSSPWLIASIAEHPVRRYVDRGLKVTINTDDPKMFGNSLAEEFRLLSDHFGFSRQEIRTLIVQGIEAAWLPAERQRELSAAFAAEPVWQEEACPSRKLT